MIRPPPPDSLPHPLARLKVTIRLLIDGPSPVIIDPVKAVRIGKGTEVVLSWTFTDEKVTRVNVFYRELGTGNWIEWEKNVKTMNITVSGLDLKTAYEFRVEMLYAKEVSGVGVVVKGKQISSHLFQMMYRTVNPTINTLCVQVCKGFTVYLTIIPRTWV